MSRYAYLVCPENKQFLWLGSIVHRDGNLPPKFWRNDKGPDGSSDLREFSEAVLVFLAKALDKEILVISEERMAAVIRDDFVEVGGDDRDDIPFLKYIEP